MKLDPNKLYFLPLGGSGEIGMNLNLYHTRGKWLMVDLGVTFDQTPGIEVLMPDTQFIEEHAQNLVGIVLTHAHEDHIGAVPHLWSRLQCPIFATPFTASLVRHKLQEAGLQAPIHEIPLSGGVDIGPFTVDFIQITHSIPEPNVLAIRTGAGTVVHTGDWKIDPDPLIGKPTDISALKKLGDEGILALVCDSTNVFVPGHSGSEKPIRKNLIDLVAKFPGRRVLIACFASNVARVASCAEAGIANGRTVGLVGRSLHRMDEVARQLNYFKDYAPFLNHHDSGFLERDKMLLICTGSQGEQRAALLRIAKDEDRHIFLEEGDVVIFSSRQIPGNEMAISNLQNLLVRKGIQVITANDEDIHVSGHPCRDELVQMYSWIRPQIVVPVHGEDHHILEQAKLALANNVPHIITPRNGDLIALTKKGPKLIDQVPSGRLALDGRKLIPYKGAVMHDRHRLMSTGHALVTLILKEEGSFKHPPSILLVGVTEREQLDTLTSQCIGAIEEGFLSLSLEDRDDDEKVGETARIATRRVLSNYYGKKTLTHVQVYRV
ncbi:MAG: MBL fold hydrolase [Alphaproteobacteria bacterium 41-28]|nr:MAG: MBL fold hydrolase [Alphaproteobacteria bacterium 41-28]